MPSKKKEKEKLSHFNMGQLSTHTKEYSYFISFYDANLVFEELHSSSLVSDWNPLNYTTVVALVYNTAQIVLRSFFSWKLGIFKDCSKTYMRDEGDGL